MIPPETTVPTNKIIVMDTSSTAVGHRYPSDNLSTLVSVKSPTYQHPIIVLESPSKANVQSQIPQAFTSVINAVLHDQTKQVTCQVSNNSMQAKRETAPQDISLQALAYH